MPSTTAPTIASRALCEGAGLLVHECFSIGEGDGSGGSKPRKHGELLWLTAFAIPVGCLLGYGFAVWMTSGFENEFYRFPTKIKSSTFAMAGLVVLSATVISSLSIFRKLGKLDLVTALKYKE